MPLRARKLGVLGKMGGSTVSGLALSTATIASGADYAADGNFSLGGVGKVYSWLATVSGVVTPTAAPLLVSNGSLADAIAAAAGQRSGANAPLSGPGLPDNGAGLAVSGNTRAAAPGASVTDAIRYLFFNETLPSGMTFVLWQSGGGQPGDRASFSFTAAGPSPLDQPVATTGWTYQPLQPSAASVTAGNGTVDVTDGSTSGSPDALVMVTTDAPISALTVRATAAASDTWGVAMIDAAAQNAAPCFLAGAAIMTPSGPVAVERLRPGEPVLARHAGVTRVAWMGRRRLSTRRHPRPETVWPFRILRDAVAPGVPARDLLLSPDHAVCLGGVLIPVKYLDNGWTVFQDRGFDQVEYWHVELPRHDILLAEALPVESYLDTGNRRAFENAGPVTALHADFTHKTWERDSCLPLWGEGGPAEHVRAMLAARADMRVPARRRA